MRHVLDQSRPTSGARPVRRFLELERLDRSHGLSRLLTRIDRDRTSRGDRRLPIYLRIARGREA